MFVASISSIRLCFGGFFEQPFDGFGVHFGVDLFEHRISLLQTQHDALLDLRKLDRRDESFERLELRVGLLDQTLLILASTQGGERLRLVALGETMACNFMLPVQDRLQLQWIHP
jgi:hypothetical protein